MTDEVGKAVASLATGAWLAGDGALRRGDGCRIMPMPTPSSTMAAAPSASFTWPESAASAVGLPLRFAVLRRATSTDSAECESATLRAALS